MRERAFFIIIIFLLFISSTIAQRKALVDIDGNKYKTVKIGKQTWMSENLRTTKFTDGTLIPVVADSTEWANLKTPAIAWYNNDSIIYKAIHGVLYNWYVISKEDNGNRSICPEGWRVPTDDDWTELSEFYGGNAVSGGKLKEPGTKNWVEPNDEAWSNSVFLALPGGRRTHNGSDLYAGYMVCFWTSTEYDDVFAWYRGLSFRSGNLGRSGANKRDGFYIRCIKE